MIEIRYPGIERLKDSTSAYDDIYQEKGILHRDSLYLLVIKSLKPQRNKILLDVSCGEGRLVELANAMGLTAIGLDISMTALIKARKDRFSSFVNGDGENLPFESCSVDYVTSVGSLEHYIEPAKGVREIARVLKPDGRACLLLPNAFGLLGNIPYVAKYGEVFDDGQPLQRYATRKTWEKMISENGMRVLKVIPYNEIETPETYRDAVWLLSHPRKLFRLLISRLIPINLCNHFIFICTL